MSRAFVNEDAIQQADLPAERMISDLPNYVTPRGQALLEKQVGSLQAEVQRLREQGDKTNQRLADAERDLRYFQAKLNTAQQVTLPEQLESVMIGAWVTYVDEDDQPHRVQLVGEDEADPSRGLVNWASPLGKALLNRRVGDEVIWQRPSGEMSIEIVDLSA